MVNFHLGWFTKKGPRKSPKNSDFPTFYEKNWDLWGPFLGDQPKWKISSFSPFVNPGQFWCNKVLPTSICHHLGVLDGFVKHLEKHIWLWDNILLFFLPHPRECSKITTFTSPDLLQTNFRTISRSRLLRSGANRSLAWKQMGMVLKLKINKEGFHR